MPIDIRQHGKVRVLLLDRPPLNSLDVVLRRDLMTALQSAFDDPGVLAIVLGGKGRAFCAGADIGEFAQGGEMLEPSLPDIISRIDAAPKPVIAAVEGACLGGGFELALGCHRRFALPSARFGLPEVKLGLLPGAGGTQRLPRAMPVPAALDLIVSGKTLPGEEAVALGIAAAAAEDAVGAAIRHASTCDAAALLGDALSRRKFSDEQRAAARPALEAARRKLEASADRYPAPLSIVEAVEAAVELAFEEGLRKEWALFQALKSSPTSAALRHGFFAERMAAKLAGIPKDLKAGPIRKAAVIGGGTMGSGIAMNFANAGIPVVMLESDARTLERGLAMVRSNYKASAKKGRLRPADVETRMSHVRGTLDYADLADADMVIEAVFEDIDVKRSVFQALDRHAGPSAILASNTSTLDLNLIAAFTSRPDRVIGTHFFSPANVMRLLEVVQGDKTSPETLLTTMQLARTIGKVGVVAGVCDGFIGNRMLEEYLRQAYFLLEEGALPAQIDGALQRWGMAMGPLAMMDMAGQDIGWKIRKRRAVERPSMVYSKIPDLICEMGRFGQKTGAGYYRYEAGSRVPIPDPQIEGLVIEHSARIGVQRRQIEDAEITGRCILALVVEGARILEEGIARRASDIDVVYLAGYGFPDFRGGPMFYAESLGLLEVLRTIRGFAANPHADPAFWSPPALLERSAAEGGRFG